MTESVMAGLRRLLVADYSRLKLRLTRRFGSSDFAAEVLHEAWLRLTRMEQAGSCAVIQDPSAYLYRVALNIAVDQQRGEQRRLSSSEVGSLVHEAIEVLDPSRIAEARLELNTLAAALENLPARRRAIFIASRLEELPHKTIALNLGVTVRVVDRELKAALDYFGTILNKKSKPRRGPSTLEPS